MYLGKGRPSGYERIASSVEYLGLPQAGKCIPTRLPHGAHISPTGLVLPQELEITQWQAVGEKLCAIENGLQWAIGDWWAYGHHAYSKRKAITIARKLPYEFGSLMNLGSVARAVKSSLRNEALSYSHHVAVAACESADQEKWLAMALEFKWSVSKLRQAINDHRTRALENCPGFGRPNEAETWAFNFLQKAERAELACTWYNEIVSEFVDQTTDATINELLGAASRATDAWSTVTESLEKLRDQRLGGARLPAARRRSTSSQADFDKNQPTRSKEKI